MTGQIEIASSVTKLGARHAGSVLIAGSHGGVYAAYLAAQAGVRAVILNDAGIGKDQAGVAGVFWLDQFGIAAAAVDAWSARIGDGRDMAARGVISVANESALSLGCRPGMAARDCGIAMLNAPRRFVQLPPQTESRRRLSAPGDLTAVWALDSASLVRSSDTGAILIIGSHGALPDGDASRALTVDALCVVFNDAGKGADEAGTSRLPALARRNIPAVTVDSRTARIGEGMSAWETGIVSAVNGPAEAAGCRVGQTTRGFVSIFFSQGALDSP